MIKVIHSSLNEARNGFNLASPGLNDKVVDNSQEQVVWGTGFLGIFIDDCSKTHGTI